MASSENVVVTQKLTKIFRDFWMREKVTAVADVDLEIHPHEIFGLLGPNGSGKSTTIKMLLGLLFPTRGRISVFGKSPSDVKAKSRIGFLAEESHLYPFLNATETLDYFGKLFRQPRQVRRKRTDMLLDMVGLSGVAHRRVGEYSKGMQRRIGLAQALINDPDLLILDEPTSGMDPLGSRKVKDLLRAVVDRGKTVILSSHLLGDVEDVCDRLTILYGGRQRATGRVEDLLARQERTELTADALDEQTLEKIKALVAESGSSIREVRTPRDRLENLFLRIVDEASAQKLSTGGAQIGGQVAAFLRGDEEVAAREGEAVIEDLVQAAEPEEPRQDEQPQQPPIEEETPEVEEPAEEVIDELVAGEPAASESEDRPPADQPTERRREEPTQEDRGVIDDLISGSDEDRKESS
jgi:ABC-2 type transport system ATP-binding protein